MRRALAIACFATLVACGAEGATGPQGEQGPPGPGATRIVLSGPATLSGTIYSVVLALPPAAGTDPTKPPAMACYLSSTPASGTWLAITDASSSTGTYCGLTFSSGHWNAVMNRMPSSAWTALFVVWY